MGIVGVLLALTLGAASLLQTFWRADEAEERALNIPESHHMNDPPQVSFSYYRLNSLAISFLVNGVLTPDLAGVLGGQHPIIPTSTLKEASSFLDRFSSPINGDTLFSESTSEGYRRLGDLSPHVASFPHRSPDTWRSYLGGNSDHYLFIPDIESARTVFETHEWHPGFSFLRLGPAVSYGQRRYSAPTVWRYLLRDDLSDYHARYREYIARLRDGRFHHTTGHSIFLGTEFWQRRRFQAFEDSIERIVDSLRYLTRRGLPDKYMVVYGAPGPHRGWGFGSWVRPLELLVLLVENVGQSPLELGHWSYREAGDTRLRSPEETDQLLNSTKVSERVLYPPAVLRPGEKVIVPLRLQFPDRGQHLSSYSTAPPTDEEVKIVEEIGRLGSQPITIGSFDGNRYFPDETLFQKTASQFLLPVHVPKPPERFDFGPALRIDTIVVDHQALDVRQADPDNFVLYAGYEKGSCPYVFTSVDGQFWLNEGNVLEAASARELKTTDAIRLTQFSGAVQLRELEHEVTFIDRVRLIRESARGASYFSPGLAALIHEDGDEVEILPGGALLVGFPLESLANVPEAQYLLEVTGYYLPLEDPSIFASAD